MSKVDQQNEAEQEEEHSAKKGEVFAPDNEETVRNEEADDDEPNPSQELGSPESVLYGRASILGRPDTKEDNSKKSVKESKGKVKTLHSDVSIARLSVAAEIEVVESEVLQLLEGPVCEHEPGKDRVDQ